VTVVYFLKNVLIWGVREFFLAIVSWNPECGTYLDLCAVWALCGYLGGGLPGWGSGDRGPVAGHAALIAAARTGHIACVAALLQVRGNAPGS